MDYLAQLNPSQKEVVLHKKGPVLVVAGAGAGKTRTLTYRVFHLIKSGVHPEKILAVTFTNKAALIMRGRVQVLLGGEPASSSPFSRDFEPPHLSRHCSACGGTRKAQCRERCGGEPFIGTFHSLGVKILREKGSEIDIQKNFIIKDREGALSLIKAAMREEGCDKKQFEPRRIQSIISRHKGELISPEEYLDLKGANFAVSIIASLWMRYEKALTKEKSLDFDDLISKTVFLLQNKKEVRDYYRERWHYVHIDEYQDTNKAQYELGGLLARPRNNICAVGDVDQNIYGWRGASIQNLLRFEKDYAGTKVVLLEENYRSTGTILKAANEIINKNKLRIEKNLFTKKGEGEKISLSVALDEKREALLVVEKIRVLLAGKVSSKDIAVLYRANFQSRILEETFLDANMPYQVLGVRFFERKEVKDIIAFIHAALNPESLGSVARVINMPPRGIGKVTIAKVFAGMRATLPQSTQGKVNDFYRLIEKIKTATQEKTVPELLYFVLTETGMKKMLEDEGGEGVERLLNINELASLAKKYDRLPQGEALEKFLEDAALASDQDALKEEKEGVRLMTVHAAKGLEFPYVFVVGLEEGLFPYQFFGSKSESSLKEKEREEEERRLFYVALTRAAKKLFLSYAETRTIFGSREHNMPSIFLKDIPEELVEYEYLDEDAAMPIIEI